MTIHVGDTAPDFELQTNELDVAGKPGKKIKLSDFRGKKNVVLAFYPLDFSPTCSNEHKCFMEDLSKIQAAGAQVIGISVDSRWAHMAYAQKMGIKYPLAADFHPRGAVADTYGLYLADKGFNARATVIVDKAGKVAWVKEEEIGQERDDRLILAELAKLS